MTANTEDLITTLTTNQDIYLEATMYRTVRYARNVREIALW